MTLGDRIKKLRKELDLTQQKFAERLGVKQNTIALIESGKRNTSDQLLFGVCREFNVSEQWLRTGDGEMILPKADTAMELLVAEHGLTVGDRVLIEKFLGLKPESRKVLVDFAREVVATIAGQEPTADSEVASTDTAETLYRSSSGYVPKADASASTTTEDTEPDQGEKMA